MRRQLHSCGPRPLTRSSPASRASPNGHSIFRPRQLFSEPRGQDTRRQMMKSMFVAIAMSGLLAGLVMAQDSEKKVKMQDLPAAVQQAVKEQSKGAKLRGL